MLNQTKTIYCHIDTYSGLEKYKKLSNNKIYKQVGSGYQLIMFKKIKENEK